MISAISRLAALSAPLMMASALMVPALPAGAVAPDAAPAVEDGYDWALRIDDSERNRPAILAYEMANTDDQPISFSCEEGGARIFAGIIGGPVTLREITLTSGDQTLKLGGTSEATELDDMPYFSSQEIPGNSPLLASFAANGWLRLSGTGDTRDMAATPVGARAITGFIEHCNRPYSPEG